MTHLICEQYDNVAFKDSNGTDVIKYSDLKDITVGDVEYKFVPVVNKLYLQYPNVGFDAFLDDESKKFAPGEIIEHFCDDSLSIGRMHQDLGNNLELTKWIGYTKDVEIENLRRECENLRKECEYLRSMNKSYQTQMDTQETIQEMEARRTGVRR